MPQTVAVSLVSLAARLSLGALIMQLEGWTQGPLWSLIENIQEINGVLGRPGPAHVDMQRLGPFKGAGKLTKKVHQVVGLNGPLGMFAMRPPAELGLPDAFLQSPFAALPLEAPNLLSGLIVDAEQFQVRGAILESLAQALEVVGAQRHGR